MDFSTLKTRTVDGLKQDLKEQSDRLIKLQFKLSSNQVKQVREIRVLKKTIARIQTLLRNSSTNITNT